MVTKTSWVQVVPTPHPPNSNDPILCINDLIDQNILTWDMHPIEHAILPAKKEAIPNVSMISKHIESDSFIWHYDKRGVFTFKSSFDLLA